ncbi:transposase domain protein [Mycobacterium xenopi 3993]|nr:transposase domain protein [Mycobacterium xenopi 3993]
MHSFTSLLTDLATICANYIQPTDDLPAFTKTTTPPRCNGASSTSWASPIATACRSQ